MGRWGKLEDSGSCSQIFGVDSSNNVWHQFHAEYSSKNRLSGKIKNLKSTLVSSMNCQILISKL